MGLFDWLRGKKGKGGGGDPARGGGASRGGSGERGSGSRGGGAGGGGGGGATPPDGPTPEPGPDAGDDLPLPAWASFFGTAERYERFEAGVRRYFLARGQRAVIQEGLLRVVDVSGGRPSAKEGQLGLGNVAQVCAQSDESEWGTIIARHFDGVEKAMSERRGLEGVAYEDVAHRLCVRLWERDDLKVGREAVTREDLPGILSTLCLDEPESIRTVPADEVAHWGMSHGALIDAALKNLERLAPLNKRAIHLGEGARLHVLGGDSFFTCAWAVRLDELDETVGEHGTLFSVPTRHMVLALPFEGVATLRHLGDLVQATRGMERDGPGSLSPRVFWRPPGEDARARTMEIPYTLGENALNVSPPPEFVEYLNNLTDGGEE
jgi:hypothetical protein